MVISDPAVGDFLLLLLNGIGYLFEVLGVSFLLLPLRLSLSYLEGDYEDFLSGPACRYLLALASFSSAYWAFHLAYSSSSISLWTWETFLFLSWRLSVLDYLFFYSSILISKHSSFLVSALRNLLVTWLWPLWLALTKSPSSIKLISPILTISRHLEWCRFRFLPSPKLKDSTIF